VTGSLDACIVLDLGALHLDVALALDGGRTAAIVGPNGAGKTTLLRALAGLEPITSGCVVLNGRVLDDPANGVSVPAEQRGIGFVFQDYLLFPHLSAIDNVAFGLRARGVGRTQARRRAVDWLQRLGLDGHGDARPDALSGGQAQRVALARALVTEPQMLLLDEPLAALDATTRAQTRRDLRRYLDGFDGVRVIVTHDVVDAAALADELIVLEAGAIAQRGTTDDISARPRSRYVADLVGVNLLQGHARGTMITLPDGSVLTSADAAEGEVLVVVHPRAVAVHRHVPEGTPRNVWAGVADSLDRHGERVRLRVTGAVPIVAEVTPAAVAALALADGGPVWVSVKATELTVLPG
jgi:molybdate transport system ATP-binding protein